MAASNACHHRGIVALRVEAACSTPTQCRARRVPRRPRSRRPARVHDVASRPSGPAITPSKPRRVTHVARDRPDLIERRRERHQPVARDAPVGRLDGRHAAERRRLPHRAARVAAERRAARQPRRARPPRCRPTNRPVRAPCPTGCFTGAEGRVLVGRAHRELVHVAPCRAAPRPRPSSRSITCASYGGT